MLADVVDAPPARKERAIQQVTPQSSYPFWFVTERTGGTYTAGVDWNPQFDDNLATARVEYELEAPGGHLFIHHIANAMSQPTRCRLAWESPIAYSVAVNLQASTWAANGIEIIRNGIITMYGANTQETWNFQEGRNIVEVMANGAAGMNNVELRGRIMPAFCKWVNPYGE